MQIRVPFFLCSSNPVKQHKQTRGRVHKYVGVNLAALLIKLAAAEGSVGTRDSYCTLFKRTLQVQTRHTDKSFYIYMKAT
jgi:hypothetical protein